MEASIVAESACRNAWWWSRTGCGFEEENFFSSCAAWRGEIVSGGERRVGGRKWGVGSRELGGLWSVLWSLMRLVVGR